MWYFMNWKWYLGLQMATMASGMFCGWAISEWHKAYTEAREAGVVA